MTRSATARSLDIRDFDAAGRLLVETYPYRSHEPASWSRPAPDERPKRWGVFHDIAAQPGAVGGLVAYASLGRLDHRKNRFDLIVGAPARRQGLGRQLFNTIVDEAWRTRAATLQARALEDDLDALAFLARRQFAETMKMRWFALALAEADAGVLTSAVNRAAASGVSIVAVSPGQGADSGFWTSIAELHDAARDGWPDPDPGGPVTTTEPSALRSWARASHDSTAAFFVAQRDGHLVGYSLLRRSTAGTAQFAATGVRPEVRGRGIGSALRAHCLLTARAAGYTTVRSASGSDALIRINERFGFERMQCEIRLVRPIR